MHQPRFSTLDLALLLSNTLVLGALLVLMAVKGPSAPLLLLLIGSLGMAIAKVGRAFARPAVRDSLR